MSNSLFEQIFFSFCPIMISPNVYLMDHKLWSIRYGHIRSLQIGQGLHHKHASKQAIISKKWSQNPLSYRGFLRPSKRTCNNMQKLFASGSALKLTVNDYPLSLFIPLGFYLFGILTYPIIRIIHRKGVFEKIWIVGYVA